MASIHLNIPIDCSPAHAWDAVLDYGALHERLVPGFVVDTRVEGDDRIVTFANGAVARERLVAADDEHRRLVYTVVESPLEATHHQASVEIVSVDDHPERCEFVWITDVLPDTIAPTIDGMMRVGADAIARTLASSFVAAIVE